jgi:hypothetical protein
VGTPTVFKAQCGDGGGGDTMVLEDALLCPSTWLVTTRTMGLIAFWKYDVRFFWQNSGAILYFPLSLESFVIGFVNEFHQLLSQKKKKFLTDGSINQLTSDSIYNSIKMKRSVSNSSSNYCKTIDRLIN